MKKSDFLLGLDLGQSADPSAVIGLRRTWQTETIQTRSGSHAVEVPHYLLGHLHRWPLHTGYPQIVSDVAELVKRPPIVNPVLVVDQTGVGAAVVDMLRQAKLAATMKPVLITSGHQVTCERGVWHVPKKELASTLISLFQSGRLKIAALAERELLIRELSTFKVKITTAGNETFESWRERDHDDLVLAAALACWWAEKSKPHAGFAPYTAGTGQFRPGSAIPMPPGASRPVTRPYLLEATGRQRNN